jgi:hypothetical protein
MPYDSGEKKRAWEKTHRKERSAAFLAQANFERAKRRDRERLKLFESVARTEDPLEKRLEYEAGLNRIYGNGNPLQDKELLRMIKRGRDGPGN